MNIVDLISHLKTIKSAIQLAGDHLPGIDYEVVQIYMVKDIRLESEIVLFDAEQLPGGNVIEIEGVTYFELLPLYMGQEMVEGYQSKFIGNISDLEIAKRMLDYKKKDA